MAITESQITELMLKIARDPKFMKKFKRDPISVLEILGIKVTKDEMDRALALASNLTRFPSRAITRFPKPELPTFSSGIDTMQVGLKPKK